MYGYVGIMFTFLRIALVAVNFYRNIAYAIYLKRKYHSKLHVHINCFGRSKFQIIFHRLSKHS